jgi:hypothetical protein
LAHVAEDFQIHILFSNLTGRILYTAAGALGAPPPDGTTFDLPPDTYRVLGIPLDEYGITVEGDCDSNGIVTLAADEPPKTCTVRFDDRIPGSVRVMTDVINDNNGTLQANEFPFRITIPEIPGLEFSAQGAPPPDGVTVPLTLDRTFTVEQDPVPGYDTTLEGDCTNVAAVPNQIKTCTIINNDVAPLPVSPPPTTPAANILNVFINVINDNGGNKTAEDFTIRLTAADGTEVAPSPTMAPPSSIFFGSLPPGTYIVTHDPIPDYTTTFGLACDSASSNCVSRNKRGM